MPIPTVKLSAIFLRVAICRFQTIGIGKTMMIKSMTTLMILVERTDATIEAQCPGRVGFHVFSKGLQVKKVERKTPTPKASTNAITLDVILQKIASDGTA